MSEPHVSKRADKHISILIPGLFNWFPRRGNSDGAPNLSLPALETVLARADCSDMPRTRAGLEARIFSAFGVAVEPDRDLPIAAVTRVLDLGVIDKEWWIRADPVHLEPHGDQLILTDGHQLTITQDQANRLAAEIMEVYTEDGWLLKTPRPGRWYLKPPRVPNLLTTPLAEVVGRDIHPYLPQGPDGKTWHTVLNELQILLHASAVNAERERSGQLPINSLWFWGGGILPKIAPARWAQVWSQEPVSLAWARLGELRSAETPASFDRWHEQAVTPGEHLVIVDQSYGALQHGALPEWIEFLKRLEHKWMEPLLDALKQGELDSVTLWADSGPSYTLAAKHVWRWWRRRRQLEAYC